MSVKPFRPAQFLPSNAIPDLSGLMRVRLPVTLWLVAPPSSFQAANAPTRTTTTTAAGITQAGRRRARIVLESDLGETAPSGSWPSSSTAPPPEVNSARLISQSPAQKRLTAA